MRRLMLGLTAGLLLSCVACSSTPEEVKMMDATLATLNKHGVVFSGTIAGPLQAGFELYQGGRLTNGGWLSLRIRGPVQNPLTGVSNVGTTQPAE